MTLRDVLFLMLPVWFFGLDPDLTSPPRPWRGPWD